METRQGNVRVLHPSHGDGQAKPNRRCKTGRKPWGEVPKRTVQQKMGRCVDPKWKGMPNGPMCGGQAFCVILNRKPTKNLTLPTYHKRHDSFHCHKGHGRGSPAFLKRKRARRLCLNGSSKQRLCSNVYTPIGRLPCLQRHQTTRRTAHLPGLLAPVPPPLVFEMHPISHTCSPHTVCAS